MHRNDPCARHLESIKFYVVLRTGAKNCDLFLFSFPCALEGLLWCLLQRRTKIKMQSHEDELHSFLAVIKAECNANNSDVRFKDSQTVCLRDTMGKKYLQPHPHFLGWCASHKHFTCSWCWFFLSQFPLKMLTRNFRQTILKNSFSLRIFLSYQRACHIVDVLSVSPSAVVPLKRVPGKFSEA